MKVAFFPKKALGSIYINGAIINKGDVIHEYGELLIDIGNYEIDEISVYNGSQKWTPIRVEGSVLVFNVLSNGVFYIRDKNNILLFSFSNDMMFDFSILSGQFNIARAAGWPWNNFPVKYSYLQYATRSNYGGFSLKVKSTGTTISGLTPRASTGIIKNFVVISDTEVQFDTPIIPDLIPISIFLGNVLVAYITQP